MSPNFVEGPAFDRVGIDVGARANVVGGNGGSVVIAEQDPNLFTRRIRD